MGVATPRPSITTALFIAPHFFFFFFLSFLLLFIHMLCRDLEITTSLTKRAPEPRLSIGVSQDGQKFTQDLTVKSVGRYTYIHTHMCTSLIYLCSLICSQGTPLTMEINLDEDSAPVYGLGVNYLDVTDTHTSSETLIFKGCVRTTITATASIIPN